MASSSSPPPATAPLSPIVPSSSSSSTSSPSSLSIDDDWEEWDGASPFWVHCTAGSLAGLVEHVAVFPLDTIRTNLQVACGLCAQQKRCINNTTNTSASTATSASTTINNLQAATSRLTSSFTNNIHNSNNNNNNVSMWTTIRNLMSEPLAAGSQATTAATTTTPSTNHLVSSSSSNLLSWIRFARLWRGVQTMLVGCIPAHALYFSSYEAVKASMKNDHHHDVLGASLAGAAAVLGHDLVMTPLDTIKQRMQLGHYSSATMAFQHIFKEGNLYKSLGVTLLTNIPHGMILVTTQEYLRTQLQQYNQYNHTQLHHWQIVLLASSLAGATAAAATTPLDRIKTCLQTQHYVPTCWRLQHFQQHPHSSQHTLSHSSLSSSSLLQPPHKNFVDAFRFIYKHEGWMGFTRGWLPRVLSQTPAAAIAWTTYETAKQYLMEY